MINIKPEINFLKEYLKNAKHDLKEDMYIEFKKSESNFPKDALKTYSAFANTSGGYIVLGVSESDGKFAITGVKNYNKIIDDLWNRLNDRDSISENLIENKDITILQVDNKDVIIIDVPEAPFDKKPIHLNKNKYNSYFRYNTGDVKNSTEKVDVLISDSFPKSYDSNVLEKFSFDDFDIKTVTSYITRFSNLNPAHPFITLDTIEFLEAIGALSKDRSTKVPILKPTVAGLLVFGKYRSIRDAINHYSVEYIDKRLSLENQERYSDRIIYDGTWGEGNLYNFFFAVIPKLSNSLISKFDVEDDNITRKDESLLHIAIREALVNSIIHCNFKNNFGIKITRYQDLIQFENGGTLRIREEEFFIGGKSNIRNQSIQEIFRLIKLCEKAGTGGLKIMQAAKENLLKPPSINVDYQSSTTKLLIWDSSISEFAKDLNSEEKKVLDFIFRRKVVKREDVEKEFNIKRTKASSIINQLRDKDYVEKIGKTKSTFYCIKMEEQTNKEFLFSSMSNILEFLKDNM